MHKPKLTNLSVTDTYGVVSLNIIMTIIYCTNYTLEVKSLRTQKGSLHVHY